MRFPGGVLQTAPTVEPVTTAEAKLWARIDISDDDALVDDLVITARRAIEDEMMTAIITQTWDWTLDAFPKGNGALHVPVGRVQSVTSISYLDGDGASQTWSSSLWRLTASDQAARITPAYGESYPTTRAVTGAVTIRFVAGFGDAASDVPEDVKSAIKLTVGMLYANRESHAPVELREFTGHGSVAALLAPYRVWAFAA